MQHDGSQKPEMRRNYKHAVDGLLRITREEGAAALFRGMVPNVQRAMLMNASQLATYDAFKDQLLAWGLFKGESLSLHFWASLGAGCVATTICSPFDVIKTRVMNAQDKSLGVWQVAKNAVAKEGFGVLFRGWTPAWIRLGPNTVLVGGTLRSRSLLILRPLYFWSRYAL